MDGLVTTDLDRFRLRSFVERLVSEDEVDVIEAPVALADVAARLDGNPKAVWFRNAGPERAELVGNVMGSRRRLALALGVEERDLLDEMRGRLARPIAPVEIASADAPVHQVVMKGEDADLTALPVHLQHGLDGAPYISATLDFSLDPKTGWTNVGMRRLMLRGRREAGIDLNAPSDLRVIYGGAHGRGDRLPIALAVGFHPADAIAALSLVVPQDEMALIGGLRGSAVPVVKCVTNDLRVPADAEIVLEGYLDADGWTEPEGPFGEYVGYYGRLKSNPVFHLTAITRRADALFQTATIGGRYMETTDTAQLCALRTEAGMWAALETAVREPVSVYATASCGGMYNARLALRQRVPGEARNAIAAVFGSTADVKHLFVVDDDIDIFDDKQIDWALATRFQADRDFVAATGFRAVPLDPSLEGARSGAKAGFDLTMPFGRTEAQEWAVPAPPKIMPAERRSLAQALADGPKYFSELMAAAGSDDGRDVIRDLERLYAEGTLRRTEDGRYRLGDGKD
jgi:2,5-furandicarboxylate decarboxylase 1